MIDHHGMRFPQTRGGIKVEFSKNCSNWDLLFLKVLHLLTQSHLINQMMIVWLYELGQFFNLKNEPSTCISLYTGKGHIFKILFDEFYITKYLNQMIS